MEGGFKRSLGTDFLTTPSGFGTCRDLMVIAKLRARLAGGADGTVSVAEWLTGGRVIRSNRT